MTGDGGPPEIPETSHGSGSPSRGGSSRPRLAARRPRPALLARRARPGACLRRCKTQRFLELIERGQRLALGRRSEEHTSELQSLAYLVCRLLLEKKNSRSPRRNTRPTSPSPRTAGW